MPEKKKRAAFRALLDRGVMIVASDAHNALTPRIIEAAGFKSVNHPVGCQLPKAE